MGIRFFITALIFTWATTGCSPEADKDTRTVTGTDQPAEAAVGEADSRQEGASPAVETFGDTGLPPDATIDDMILYLNEEMEEGNDEEEAVEEAAEEAAEEDSRDTGEKKRRGFGLSEEGKAALDKLREKMKALGEKRREICGLDRTVFQEVRDGIKAIRDDDTLDRKEKRAKARALFESRKEDMKKAKADLQTCKEQKTAELEEVHQARKELMTACFPGRRMGPKPGEDDGANLRGGFPGGGKGSFGRGNRDARGDKDEGGEDAGDEDEEGEEDKIRKERPRPGKAVLTRLEESLLSEQCTAALQ